VSEFVTHYLAVKRLSRQATRAKRTWSASLWRAFAGSTFTRQC